jgi:ribosomal protein S14
MYTQAEYDCQVCGRPETDVMRKRVFDFVRPTCDECVELIAHEGHLPNVKVRVDRVVVAQRVVVGPDNKERLTMAEQRDTKYVRYADWEWRCRKCVP